MSPDDMGRSGRSGEFHDQEGRTLPERIRERRKARGLKSMELARALEVSPSYVTMIERGKKVPSEEMALAIAEFLGDDPELYSAWVHSTRFTDPTSTLRGLQRLYYSGPRSDSPPPRNSRLQSLAERFARRLRSDSPPMSAPDADRDESIEFLEARHVPRSPVVVERRRAGSPAPAFGIPLIALGGVSGHELRFWRLPWALLDNDPRPLRFVVAPTGRPEKLLVATPEQFVEIVMRDRGIDLMQSAEWLGWQPPAPEGGAHARPLDLDGRLAPLLRDSAEFLESLGERVDVILREGTGVAIRRMPSVALEWLLASPGAPAR